MTTEPRDPRAKAPQTQAHQDPAPQSAPDQAQIQRERSLERDLDALASRAAIAGLRFVRNPPQDVDTRVRYTRIIAIASAPTIAFLTLVSGQWPGGLIWSVVFPVVFYWVVGRLARRGGPPHPGADPVDWRPGPAAYRAGGGGPEVGGHGPGQPGRD